MNYLRIINGIVNYPYSIELLKQSYPNTSFVNDVYTNYELLKIYDVYPVETTALPSYNTITERLTEGLPQFDNSSNTWKQVWVLTNNNPTEIAEKTALAKQNLENAVQNRLDSFAKTRGYDNCLSCCSYATSTNTTFQQEAQYCVQARDTHWSTYNAIMQQVDSNQRVLPSTEQLLSEMPILQWPV
jgi:hypothetical protein